MPADFAPTLCGFRGERHLPNTSDAGGEGSIELGQALFDVMRIPRDQSGPSDTGSAMEIAMVSDFRSLRPDLRIDRSRRAFEFEQYEHLAAYPRFRKGHESNLPIVEAMLDRATQREDSAANRRLVRDLKRLHLKVQMQDDLVGSLRESMPEESLLKVDVTAGASLAEGEQLVLALSSKWSLRTDRAQDCVSQGAKLASLRRGPMPHYAVVTMEPRPGMLKLIADNSGAVDCVYHLHLPALTEAIAIVRKRKTRSWSPGLVFDRLIAQRRLRDFSDLRQTVRSLPVPVGEGDQGTTASQSPD